MSAPGLVWQACLKKTGIKLELLTDVNMLLMVGRGIRCGIFYAINTWKIIIKIRFVISYIFRCK